MVLEQDTFILAFILVQLRKTRPCLMGRKELKQTKTNKAADVTLDGSYYYQVYPPVNFYQL